MRAGGPDGTLGYHTAGILFLAIVGLVILAVRFRVFVPIGIKRRPA